MSAKTSKTTIFFGGLFAIAVAMMVFGGHDAPVASVAPRVKTQEDVRFDLALDAARAIRNVMREPDSLKFDYIGVNAAATVACLKYRARNGFGGMNVEFSVLENNKIIQNKASDWQRYCMQPLQDLTAAGS